MTVQLAPHEPVSPELVRDMQAWKDDYPWLHQAIKEIGPGARGPSEGWWMRIEDELKTTLDFKVRPDGTAVVWCGMSGYDFHHDPTPKELFEGLGEAYRRERKRIRGSDRWKMSANACVAQPDRPKPQRPPVRTRTFSAPMEDLLARRLGAVLLSRLEPLMVIFVAITALTFVLAGVAATLR